MPSKQNKNLNVPASSEGRCLIVKVPLSSIQHPLEDLNVGKHTKNVTNVESHKNLDSTYTAAFFQATFQWWLLVFSLLLCQSILKNILLKRKAFLSSLFPRWMKELVSKKPCRNEEWTKDRIIFNGTSVFFYVCVHVFYKYDVIYDSTSTSKQARNDTGE